MPVVKRKRMFRGAARGKVFQTVDLGAGAGSYIERQAERYPKRKYAAVDPMLASTGFFSTHARRLASKGVKVGQHAKDFLREMIRSRWKTRHLNIDMPYPWDTQFNGAGSREAFFDVLDMIPHVLLPNGKMYITSENRFTIRAMMGFAKERGYAVRETKPILPAPVWMPGKVRANIYRSPTMHSFQNFPLYRMELTYNLKKVFPEKEARRRYSGARKKETSNG